MASAVLGAGYLCLLGIGCDEAVEGFLLCISEGFLAPEELEQGQQATAADGIGPSLALEAPPVPRTSSRDWEASDSLDSVQAVVVDLAAHIVGALGP